MTQEQAKEKLRSYLPVYLRDKGVDVAKGFFRCLNPDHDDFHPSMSYCERTKRVKCWSCGAEYDIVDLIAMDYGLSVFDAFMKGYSLYGIDYNGVNSVSSEFCSRKVLSLSLDDEDVYGDVSAYISKCESSIKDTDYTAKRGLSFGIVSRFHLGYDDNFSVVERVGSKFVSSVWRALIIPTGVSSYVVRNTDEFASERNRIRKFGPSMLFNADALVYDKPVFIVEGEIDALSIMDVGAESVALGGTSGIGLLLRYIRDNNIVPKYPLLLALDSDKAGVKASRMLADGLVKVGIPFRLVDVFLGRKDANEALVFDRDGFAEVIRRSVSDVLFADMADLYKFSSAFFWMGFKSEIARRCSVPPVSTGYAALDAVLNGGLVPGLYIIGAVSGLGKTSFCMQMADQAAICGCPAVVFSFEMSRYELMARSLAREMHQVYIDLNIADGDLSLTASNILDGSIYSPNERCRSEYNDEQKRFLRIAEEMYCSYSGEIYIIECGIGFNIFNIRETVELFISRYKIKPVIFIDYLQLISSDSDVINGIDKQRIDVAVAELKRLSLDFNVPIVAVSSFNRQGYNGDVRFDSFKESGAIEYSADVLIGLQFKGAGGDRLNAAGLDIKVPYCIEAVILKNRNGRAGDRVDFIFDGRYSFFMSSDDLRNSSLRWSGRPSGKRAVSDREAELLLREASDIAVDVWNEFAVCSVRSGSKNDKAIDINHWRRYFCERYDRMDNTGSKRRIFAAVLMELAEEGRVVSDGDFYTVCDS